MTKRDDLKKMMEVKKAKIEYNRFFDHWQILTRSGTYKSDEILEKLAQELSTLLLEIGEFTEDDIRNGFKVS